MFTKADIEKYFVAEKNFGLLFAIVGVAAILAALVFYFALKTNFYKGAAIPLLLTGLLFGIAGFAVYKKSDADRMQNVYAYDMNPDQLKEKEIPRMEKVMTNFVLYRWIEIIFAVAGIGLFFYFKNDATTLYWKGLGAGLAMMALITLLANCVAEKRGLAYLQGLKEWVNKGRGAAAPRP